MKLSGNLEDKKQTWSCFRGLISSSSVQTHNSIHRWGASSEFKFTSRWKRGFCRCIMYFIPAWNQILISELLWKWSWGLRCLNLAIWSHQYLALFLIASAVDILRVLARKHVWGKPNISAKFSVGAHFQITCQFGEERLVWNIEQVQMTCARLLTGRRGQLWSRR